MMNMEFVLMLLQNGLKGAGYDLKGTYVNEDIINNKEKYNIEVIDKNIDLGVRNLDIYLKNNSIY